MMDASILQALAQLLRQRQGTTAGPVTPSTSQDPMFAARQLAGGGAFGQALAAHQSMLDNPDQQQPQQQPMTLGALGSGAAPAQRPVFSRPDDPSTMSPEQLIAYMQAHGIKKRTAGDNLNDVIAKLLGRGQAQ